MFCEYRDNIIWMCGEWDNNNNLINGYIHKYLIKNKYYKVLYIKNYKIIKTILHNPNKIKNTNIIKVNKYLPIKSNYRGYNYRSLLEVKWAYFFDLLNIDYIYEPFQVLLSNNKKYTIDFYLPKLKYWIEVKPTYPIELELLKAELFKKWLNKSKYFQNSNNRVFILYGSCNQSFINKFNQGSKAIEILNNNKTIEPLTFNYCKKCLIFELIYKGICSKCKIKNYNNLIDIYTFINNNIKNINNIKRDIIIKSKYFKNNFKNINKDIYIK